MSDSVGRAEPFGMTVADAMAVVLGCALAFSLPEFQLYDSRVECSFSRPRFPTWAPLLFDAAKVALRGSLALSVVIVARGLRWRHAPRPPDWLCLLSSMILICLIVDSHYEHVSDYVYDLAEYGGSLSHFAEWWILSRSPRMIAGATLASVLLGAAAQMARWRRPFLRTIFLVAAGLMFVWGPILSMNDLASEVIYSEVAGSYFGIDHVWRREVDVMLDLVLRRLAGGLIFGLLIAASLRRRGAGRWTDLPTLVLMIPLAAYALSDWFYDWPATSLVIEDAVRRSVVLVGWSACVAGAAWLGVRRLGPAWNLWLGLGYDGSQAASSPSEA